jgi:hypothetical protein
MTIHRIVPGSILPGHFSCDLVNGVHGTMDSVRAKIG